MPRHNELEENLQALSDLKVINLDVTLASMVRGGALAGLDPWDVWCGNGWILRRRGGGIGPRIDAEVLRDVVRAELAQMKG